MTIPFTGIPELFLTCVRSKRRPYIYSYMYIIYNYNIVIYIYIIYYIYCVALLRKKGFSMGFHPAKKILFGLHSFDTVDILWWQRTDSGRSSDEAKRSWLSEGDGWARSLVAAAL